MPLHKTTVHQCFGSFWLPSLCQRGYIGTKMGTEEGKKDAKGMARAPGEGLWGFSAFKRETDTKSLATWRRECVFTGTGSVRLGLWDELSRRWVQTKCKSWPRHHGVRLMPMEHQTSRTCVQRSPQGKMYHSKVVEIFSCKITVMRHKTFRLTLCKEAKEQHLPIPLPLPPREICL